MPSSQLTFLSLTIRPTEEQLGFLAYLYPNEDPEEALIRERLKPGELPNHRHFINLL